MVMFPTLGVMNCEKVKTTSVIADPDDLFSGASDKREILAGMVDGGLTKPPFWATILLGVSCKVTFV